MQSSTITLACAGLLEARGIPSLALLAARKGRGGCTRGTSVLGYVVSAFLARGRMPQLFLASTAMSLASAVLAVAPAVSSLVVGKENHGLEVAGFGPVLRVPGTPWWPL